MVFPVGKFLILIFPVVVMTEPVVRTLYHSRFDVNELVTEVKGLVVPHPSIITSVPRQLTIALPMSTPDLDVALLEIQRNECPNLQDMVPLQGVSLSSKEASKFIGRGGKTIRWMIWRVKEAMGGQTFVPHPTVGPDLSKLDGTQVVYLKQRHYDALTDAQRAVYAETINKWLRDEEI